MNQNTHFLTIQLIIIQLKYYCFASKNENKFMNESIDRGFEMFVTRSL
jgi:hypothetical protein